MKKSNVTVIIPCYNDAIYINKAVNSIISQTLQADEIIIIDDGSNKETKRALKKINYPNIKIITQENLGVCKARNNAIKKVKTKYILTLDSDDFFEPTFIEKAVNFIEKDPDIGVVGCYFRWFNEENKNLRSIKATGGKVKDFLYGNKGIGNALFRKICWEQVGGYDEKMIYGYEDWEFWIAITALGWKYHIIKEPLFNYRRKKSSRDITAKNKHDLELKKYIFKKHKKLYALHINETLNYCFENIEKHKKQKLLIQHSLEYKIGAILLKPLKYLSKNFKN